MVAAVPQVATRGTHISAVRRDGESQVAQSFTSPSAQEVTVTARFWDMLNS